MVFPPYFTHGCHMIALWEYHMMAKIYVEVHMVYFYTVFLICLLVSKWIPKTIHDTCQFKINRYQMSV